MSNDFFNASGAPTPNAEILSVDLRSEYSSIAAGFDKMPGLTGYASKPVRVNAAGTALEAFSGGGTNTPTVTATLNCNTPVTTKAILTQNYNTVTVAGKAGVTCIAAGAVTFEIALPVASNLAVADDLTGLLNVSSGIGNVSAAFITTSTANNTAIVNFTAAAAGAVNFRYLLMYSVL